MLTIFQVDEVHNPPHVVLQKHEDDLLDSRRASKYQCGDWSVTFTRPSSEKLAAFNIGSVLEHRAKERFLKDSLPRSVVDGRQGRSSIQKRAMLGQPGTDRALQLIRIELVTASESEVLTDQELIKLSSSAICLSGLLL